jgi:hypothetical protein
MVLLVLGVAGSGRTTVGDMLAKKLAWTFLDADHFHAAANREKMHLGIPLTDADRLPWLTSLHEELLRRIARGETIVLACSALREAYREILGAELRVTVVYLRASAEQVRGHDAGLRFCRGGSVHESLQGPLHDHGHRLDDGLHGGGPGPEPARQCRDSRGRRATQYSGAPHPAAHSGNGARRSGAFAHSDAAGVRKCDFHERRHRRLDECRHSSVGERRADFDFRIGSSGAEVPRESH